MRETRFAIDPLCDRNGPSIDKNNYDKIEIKIRSFMQFSGSYYKPASRPRYLLLSFVFVASPLSSKKFLSPRRLRRMVKNQMTREKILSVKIVSFFRLP